MGSSSKERAAASAANAAATAEIQKAVAELEKIGVPSAEAQRIAISKYSPDVVGQLEAEELGPSAMDDIDPRLKGAQMSALTELQERGEVGLTTEDKARFSDLQREIEGSEQARQKGILQSMASRGAGGSGSELAMRLASSQGSADRASRAGTQMGAEAAAGRRQALSQASQVAGQMHGQESKAAQAKDIIAQFNVSNRQSIAQRNLMEQQRIADQRQAIQRQQEQYNKEVIGKQYGQQMEKAGAISQARTGVAQNFSNQAAAASNAAAQKTAAKYGLAGSAIGATGSAVSDVNVKEDIKPIKSEELSELLDKVQGYKYNYKDDKYGEGEHSGVMAQDLEQSKLGKKFVQEDEEGVKRIDYNQMAGTILASQAELNDRLKALEEGQKFDDGGVKSGSEGGGKSDDEKKARMAEAFTEL